MSATSTSSSSGGSTPKPSKSPTAPTSSSSSASYSKGGKLLLRIGQFNTLNLVKENCIFYGHEKYSKEKVDKKVDWISEQLQRMQAHIVGFEEVFHEEPLKRAVKASGIYDKNAQVVSFANGSAPTVALVSAFPVVDKMQIKDFPKEAILQIDGYDLPYNVFQRPLLKCVIELPTEDKLRVTVFVLHAKSKRPVVSDPLRHDQKAKAVGHALSLVQRAAEAAAFRCIIVDEIRHHKRPVIVIGDLNDTVHSVTTEIITGTPPWKKLPKVVKEDIWDVLLYSTNEIQVRNSDRDVTYSHIHNGRYEVLDHILVSKEFCKYYPKSRGHVQYISIFNDHLLDETYTDLPRTNIESDHGQIVAVIKIFPPVKPEVTTKVIASMETEETE